MSGSCRSCGTGLEYVFVDLGESPLANSLPRPGQLDTPDPTLPLKVFACDSCLLVQLPPHARPEVIFDDYPYFSSYSTTWVEHARRFANEAARRYGLRENKQVVEVASNDGYLLQHFQALGIAVLGIEPARTVAAASREKGIPTREEFFGAKLADELVNEGVRADLLVANNVLAHVPDLNDFLRGIVTLLADDGVATIEFPHLLNLIRENQFDTIYHEHYSYFSLLAFRAAVSRHALRIIDVEKLPTHGGSLRVHLVGPRSTRGVQPMVDAHLEEERDGGMDRIDVYTRFQQKVEHLKQDLVRMLRDLKRDGKQVVAYGAPAKGNTLLNFCGIGPELVSYTVDLNPYKQGRLLPGSRIPIHAPAKILETRPDYVLILPWNIQHEIMEQMKTVREWGGRFLVPIPRPQVVP